MEKRSCTSEMKRAYDYDLKMKKRMWLSEAVEIPKLAALLKKLKGAK